MKNKAEDLEEVLYEDDKSDQDWIIQIGFLIHDTARLRRVVLDEKFKPLSITRSQAWLLAYLSRSEGLPQSSLADQMGLGKVALGGLIDRLESNGLIERRSDPRDRRINNIFLTEKGRDVTAQMRKLTLEANKDILKGVDIEQVKAGVQLLTKLKQNLQWLRDNQ